MSDDFDPHIPTINHPRADELIEKTLLNGGNLHIPLSDDHPLAKKWEPYSQSGNTFRIEHSDPNKGAAFIRVSGGNGQPFKAHITNVHDDHPFVKEYMDGWNGKKDSSLFGDSIFHRMGTMDKKTGKLMGDALGEQGRDIFADENLKRLAHSSGRNNVSIGDESFALYLGSALSASHPKQRLSESESYRKVFEKITDNLKKAKRGQHVKSIAEQFRYAVDSGWNEVSKQSKKRVYDYIFDHLKRSGNNEDSVSNLLIELAAKGGHKESQDYLASKSKPSKLSRMLSEATRVLKRMARSKRV